MVVNVGLTGDPDGDSPVIAGLARAGIAVPPRVAAGAAGSGHRARATPMTRCGPRSRAVVDAARSGVPWGRMAVVWGAAEPYARIVDAQLAAADIPSNGTPVRTVADSVAGRALLAVLGLGDRRFRRPDVMAVIADAGVVDGRGHPVPGRAWERISREAGVVEGDDWARRLGAHAARLSARADEDDAEDRAASAGQRRRDAASAAGLAAFVGELRADLERVAATGTWRGMATATAALLDRLLGGAPARTVWPDEEQRAADRVDAALAGLGGLDTIGGPPPTLDVFRRSLAASLSAALRRSGRFGEGVLVGPLSVVTGLDLDVVIVLGLAEGTLPAAHLEDSLLPDRDARRDGRRARLARRCPARGTASVSGGAGGRGSLDGVLPARGSPSPRRSRRLPVVARRPRRGGRPTGGDDQRAGHARRCRARPVVPRRDPPCRVRGDRAGALPPTPPRR